MILLQACHLRNSTIRFPLFGSRRLDQTPTVPGAAVQSRPELYLVGVLIALQDGPGLLPAAEIAKHLIWIDLSIGLFSDRGVVGSPSSAVSGGSGCGGL